MGKKGRNEDVEKVRKFLEDGKKKNQGKGRGGEHKDARRRRSRASKQGNTGGGGKSEKKKRKPGKKEGTCPKHFLT